MEDDREKLKLDRDEGEEVEVEGHKLEPTEGEKFASDEGEDVEGHKL
jgi:hypothetical protein